MAVRSEFRRIYYWIHSYDLVQGKVGVTGVIQGHADRGHLLIHNHHHGVTRPKHAVRWLKT